MIVHSLQKLETVAAELTVSSGEKIQVNFQFDDKNKIKWFDVFDADRNLIKNKEMEQEIYDWAVGYGLTP